MPTGSAAALDKVYGRSWLSTPSCTRSSLPRVETGRIQAAVRLLICYQYLTDNPVADVDAIMSANPALAEDEMAGWVVEELRKHGSFPVC